MVWQQDRLFEVPVSAVIKDNVLYTSWAFESVVAYDLSSGTVLWRSTEPHLSHTEPYLALSGDHVVVAQGAGRIYSLAADSGQTEWDRHIADTVGRAAAAPGGLVVVNGDRHVYALRSADGTPVWQADSFGQETGTPLVVDGRVYWSTAKGTVISANLQDGAVVWTSGTETEAVCPPIAVDSGSVWIRALHPGDHLVRYDKLTGAEMSRQPMRGPLFERLLWARIGPVVDSGMIYLVSGNRLSAFDTRTSR